MHINISLVILLPTSLVHIIYFGFIWPIMVTHREKRIEKEALDLLNLLKPEPNNFLQFYNSKTSFDWKDCESLRIRYPQTIIFNLVGVIAGWSSLYGFLYYLNATMKSGIEKISGGAATLLIFLAIVSVLGLSAKLPEMIHRGKWPKA